MDYNITVTDNVIFIDFLERLTTNRQYTITLEAGISGVFDSGLSGVLESDYEFWFTSLYCPLFTTLGRVKLQAGPSIDSIPDDTIYRMIHKNSMDAVDLYNTYHDSSFAYDYWGCDWQGAPYIFRRYAECKTAYDLLAIIELVATGNGVGAGGQLKTLGDLTIRYDGDSGRGAANAFDPSRKKQLYDCWMEAFHAMQVTGNAGIQPAVRGWYDVTKSYVHPVFDTNHNRIVRTVDFKNSNPKGPWWPSTSNWRPNI